MFVGYLVLGTIGALTLISTFGSTRVMDRWVLRAVDARPVGRREMPRVYRVLEELASRAEVPVPLLRVAPSDVPNAFTVGRSPENASIALTEGLLYSLDFRQLSGVIAHEVARIRGRDLLLQSYAAAVTRLLRSIWIVAPAGVRG
jgi:heat shock protein HtpX